MNETAKIFQSKYLFIIVLVLSGLAGVMLAPHTAVNVDEQLHYPHAKKVVNWYYTAGKDTSCLYTPKTNLKYYGQSVDNFTALANRIFNFEDEFLVRHFTGAFFFWLLLLIAGLISRYISGSWLAGCFTMLALIFIPRLSGQAFGNLKDIPFATGYLAGIFFIIKFIKELPSPSWRTSILLGLSIAFTVSVRSGGFILFPYLAAGLVFYFAFKPDLLIKIISDRPLLLSIVFKGLIIFITGYFGGLIFWPYALQNVFVNPLESLTVMEHYSISIKQLFEGRIQWSTDLPWYYLPKWILISTPLFFLTGSIIFTLFFVKGLFSKKFTDKIFFEGILLFSFIFPCFYVIAIGSNLYSGVRQMLFIMPPLAVISVLGVYKLIRYLYSAQKSVSYVISIVFFILLVWPIKHQIATFPVDYVYFNCLATNRQHWGNYEYDYYFHGIKEPAEYLINLAGGEDITVAMNCNLSNYFDKHSNISYRYTRFLERSSADWDYGIFGLNYIHPSILRDGKWKPEGILKVFYHKGNPVSVLIKRTDKTDFYGILEIKNGNLSGISLLENAVKKDTNNIWLYVNLAKAGLMAEDIQKFQYYLNRGKQIHPCYEPLFLLEAKYLFDKGDYSESMSVLKKLFEINPRYLPAKQLFGDLKSKLNF
jgi:hypothetical protein